MKLLVVLCAVVAMAVAYQSGAPEGACSDMVPQHGAPAQTTPFPYVIQLSSNSIKPKGKVYITLNSAAGDSFKGFFIQARVGGVAVGKFEPADGVKLINCGNGVNSGATHANPQPKEKVVVAWEAPPSLSEKVVFTVTVARDGGTYWVAHESSPLTVKP